MLKRKFISAIAGVLAFATTTSGASAQGINVTVKIPSGTQQVFTNNTGGAWGGSIVANPVGPVLPTFVTGNAGLPILYCIDQGRFFNLDMNMSMRLLTFDQFVNNKPAGISPWANMDLNDLNAMATLASTYTPTLTDNATRAANGTIQNQIWNIGNTNPVIGMAPDVSSNWRVLVDLQDWTGSPEGDRTNGAQTFLVQVRGGTQVPEPSSFALVGVGLVGLFVATRRRNNVA